jgi:hypothetical protein
MKRFSRIATVAATVAAVTLMGQGAVTGAGASAGLQPTASIQHVTVASTQPVTITVNCEPQTSAPVPRKD